MIPRHVIRQAGRMHPVSPGVEGIREPVDGIRQPGKPEAFKNQDHRYFPVPEFPLEDAKTFPQSIDDGIIVLLSKSLIQTIALKHNNLKWLPEIFMPIFFPSELKKKQDLLSQSLTREWNSDDGIKERLAGTRDPAAPDHNMIFAFRPVDNNAGSRCCIQPLVQGLAVDLDTV